MGNGCLTEVIDQAESCPMSEEQMAFVALEVSDFMLNFAFAQWPHILLTSLQSCKALHYIHSLHRVHRDIKSDNLLISDAGDIKIGGRSSLQPKRNKNNLPDTFPLNINSGLWLRRSAHTKKAKAKHSCGYHSIRSPSTPYPAMS